MDSTAFALEKYLISATLAMIHMFEEQMNHSTSNQMAKLAEMMICLGKKAAESADRQKKDYD